MATGNVGFIYTRQERVGADGVSRVSYRRDPFFSDHRSLLTASVSADAAPWMRDLADLLPKEAYKALSALGYAMQKNLRADIIKGGPPGTTWAKLSPVHSSGSLDAVRGRARNKRRGKFFGQLYYPIGYFRYPLPRMRVDIGWLSASSQRLGYMLQRGATVPVTGKTQRLYALAKRRLKPKSIETPARPLMREAFEARQNDLSALFESKIARYVARSSQWMHETRSNAGRRNA